MLSLRPRWAWAGWFVDCLFCSRTSRHVARSRSHPSLSLSQLSLSISHPCRSLSRSKSPLFFSFSTTSRASSLVCVISVVASCRRRPSSAGCLPRSSRDTGADQGYIVCLDRVKSQRQISRWFSSREKNE